MLNAMDEMRELITRLEAAGIAISKIIEQALLQVDIRYFSDYNADVFYHDRPLVFLETKRGGVKTISAPHMIVSMLEHMELETGQDVLVLGAKGGYLSSLISSIVGPEGKVVVVDPSEEVLSHVRRCIKDINLKSGISVRKMNSISHTPSNLPKKLQRVIITGSLKKIPTWIQKRLDDGGFVLSPIGGKISQNLIKREKQGTQYFDTDLGSVLFGPVDVSETEAHIPEPQFLADILEEALKMGKDMDIIGDQELIKLENLILELRILPDDLPPLKFNLFDAEESIEAEDELFSSVNEMSNGIHPLIEILERESTWLHRVWPLLAMLFDVRMAHPGSYEGESLEFGNHGDLIP